MFVSVKSLTALIDQDIQFYIEGVASKEQHSPEDFENDKGIDRATKHFSNLINKGKIRKAEYIYS